jgi:hypothetical protein
MGEFPYEKRGKIICPESILCQSLVARKERDIGVGFKV